MNLYYEHHRTAAGEIALTEIRLSSYSNGSLAIEFKNTSEATLFEICKTILKWPPVAQRSYDDKSKVWSYLGDYGAQVITKLQKITKPIKEIQCVEVQDLAAQALSNRIDLTGKRTRIKPEDFFYQQAPAATPALSREQVRVKLITLMEFGIDQKEITKTDYRRAAMRLHPDRNNGDSTRMAELNMLWQIYNS